MDIGGRVVLAAGMQFFSLSRVLIVVGAGILTVYFDGRLMNQKGLHREAAWAKAFGWLLVVSGIGAWAVLRFFFQQ